MFSCTLLGACLCGCGSGKSATPPEPAPEKTYTIVFYAGDTVMGTQKFSESNKNIVEPMLPAREGYSAAWEPYSLGSSDITVHAVYTPLVYTVRFYADGNIVSTKNYTVETTEIAEPGVPQRSGYTGEWSQYSLNGGNKEVQAVYTPITYTVTFTADGKTVSVQNYTVENTYIRVPPVPEKAGYAAAWEAYTLTGGDKTVRAVYTRATEPDGTAYRIAVDRTVAAEYNAALLLQKYIRIATGKTLAIVSPQDESQWNTSFHVISVGKTMQLTQAALGSYAVERAKYDGYIIKNVGNSLFIDGVNDRGTVNGVLGYLERAFGYTFIDATHYSYTAATDLPIANTDICFTPTFETRSYLMYETYYDTTEPETALYRHANNYMLGDMSAYGGKNILAHYGNNPAHNMQATFIAGVTQYNAAHGTHYDYRDYCIEFEANGANHLMPCLTGGKDSGDAKVETFITLAMKNMILTRYSADTHTFVLTQEDSGSDYGYCTCASCTAAENEVGRSGILLRFVNKVIENLENDPVVMAKAPDFKIMTYAYTYTAQVPKVSPDVLRAHDRLTVMLCLSPQDGRYSLFDETHNPRAATSLGAWGDYTARMMFWGYDVNFSCYAEYFPSVGRQMADNVYGLKQLGMEYVMLQGAHNAPNVWDSELRSYVYGKMLYAFDEAAYKKDADAYVRALAEEYANAYYGKHAAAVMDIVDHYQTEYGKVDGSAGNVFITMGASITYDAKLTLSQHEAAVAKADAMLAAETDESMRKKLYAIKASAMGPILRQYEYFYRRPVIGLSEWKQKAIAYADNFAQTAAAGGITRWYELGTVDAFVQAFKNRMA